MNRHKIFAVSPELRLADVSFNEKQLLGICRQAASEGFGYVVFPKDSLCGTGLGDLAGQKLLQSGVKAAERRLKTEAEALGITLVLESCRIDGIVFECAADPWLVGSVKAKIDEIRRCSAEEKAVYVYVNAGSGASTTDFAYSGAVIMAENGELLCAPEVLPWQEEVLEIQSRALASRLGYVGSRSAVVGVSGGLDSTLALLAAVKAADALSWDRKRVTGVTMPGFGTGGRTYDNAVALMDALGITSREVSIVPAVTGHLNDIGHPLDRHDLTYENAQARERTQILMDIAGDEGGLVVGTGDMSELALGWCTYNGDHMSMYSVNAGVTKTAIREVVGHAARHGFRQIRGLLEDVVSTPVSPELLPGAQVTEDIVGPYALHDFFLVRFLQGMTPREILAETLAEPSLSRYRDCAGKWLGVFIKRFFSSAFKRSCSPDGPAVFPYSLSPRQGFRMPSDASPALWLSDLPRE